MQLRNWSAQTQATYRAGLQSLLAFLDSQGVHEIQRLSLELLERYRLHLFEKRYRGKPLKLSTQSVRLTAAKAFKRFLRQTHVLLLDVGADLELPKVPRGLPRVLSEDEAVRLVEAPDVSRPAGVRDRAMLEVFYASGARNSELGRLQLPDIDWDQQALWIRQGKGGKDRLVPLGEEALAWLEEYLQRVRPVWAKTAGELHVFLTYRGRPMGREQVGAIVSRWARVAELQGVTPHTSFLRILYASVFRPRGSRIMPNCCAIRDLRIRYTDGNEGTGYPGASEAGGQGSSGLEVCRAGRRVGDERFRGPRGPQEVLGLGTLQPELPSRESDGAGRIFDPRGSLRFSGSARTASYGSSHQLRSRAAVSANSVRSSRSPSHAAALRALSRSRDRASVFFRAGGRQEGPRLAQAACVG